jgi:ribosomal protein L25 (general stress protein Ctc)
MAIRATVHHGLTKGQRKEWRRKGYATASLYGKGVAPLQLLVPVREVMDAIVQQGGKNNAVLELSVQNGSRRLHTVRVKEIQRHLTTHEPIHFDFHIQSHVILSASEETDGQE